MLRLVVETRYTVLLFVTQIMLLQVVRSLTIDHECVAQNGWTTGFFECQRSSRNVELVFGLSPASDWPAVLFISLQALANLFGFLWFIFERPPPGEEEVSRRWHTSDLSLCFKINKFYSRSPHIHILRLLSMLGCSYTAFFAIFKSWEYEWRAGSTLE